MKKSVPVKVLALLLASSIMPAPARAAVGTWNANPTNGDWNVPSNWSSLAAPNGPADIASFGLSSITSVFLSANTQVDSIIFNPGASGYTITAGRFRTLSISGAGVVNNSGVAQALVAAGADSSTGSGLIRFTQNAQVGASISLTSSGSGNVSRDGAVIEFRDASSGGNGTVTAAGGAIAGAWGGTVRFLNASTAAQAVIGVNPDAVPRAAPGIVEFHNASTAAQATITNNGARFGGGGFPDFGGEVRFRDNATAAEAAITNGGGTAPEAGGSITRFENSSTAANATIINNGSSVVGGFSGITGFYDNSNAGNSVIVSNGAIWGYTTGGVTLFAYKSDAGTATLIANSVRHRTRLREGRFRLETTRPAERRGWRFSETAFLIFGTAARRESISVRWKEQEPCSSARTRFRLVATTSTPSFPA